MLAPARLLHATVLTLSLLRATSLRAAPARCIDSSACAELVDKAKLASKAGQNEDALSLYRAAYKLQPDPRLFYNIARILHRSGRPAEAVDHYQRVLDSGVDEGDMRPKATEYLTQARAESAQQRTAQQLTAQQLPPPDAKVPVHKKPWFWVVIGIAGAAVAGGIVAGAVVGTRPRPPEGTEPFTPLQ